MRNHIAGSWSGGDVFRQLLTIASLDDEGDITKAIEKLDIISEKFKVKFILSVSRNIDKLPECAKERLSFLYKWLIRGMCISHPFFKE